MWHPQQYNHDAHIVARFAARARAQARDAARLPSEPLSRRKLTADPSRFYTGGNAPTPPKASAVAGNLSKLFDKYLDDPDEKDLIGPTGTMQYLQDLGVQLDEAAMLAVLHEISAPTVGELSRKPFVDGWAGRGADTIAKQQAVLANMRKSLGTDAPYFRKVYRNAFLLARAPGQKSVALDAACEFWRLLFGEQGWRWNSKETDWLEEWVGFVETKWKKSVGKDMWDQTEIFAQKCLEDGSLGWWDEEQSWPGVLDDFAVFMREKLGKSATGEEMDVE
jgi:DCN1-like protein 1/2